MWRCSCIVTDNILYSKLYWDDLYHYCRVSCQNQLSLKTTWIFQEDNTSFCFNVKIKQFTTSDTATISWNIVTKGKSTRLQWYPVQFSYHVCVREEVFHEEISHEKWTKWCTLGTCPETTWYSLNGLNIIVIILVLFNIIPF